MRQAPGQTVFRGLSQLRHSVLLTSFSCRQGCPQVLSQHLPHIDIRLLHSYTDSTRPLHTTASRAGAQLGQIAQILPRYMIPLASPVILDRPVVTPLIMPIPAASSGRPLSCKLLSSCQATGEPPDPPRDPFRDPPRDPSKAPSQTSCSDISPQQPPLLGLQKKKMSSGPVAVAVSGGVDSAVAAMLLKKAG